MVSVVGQVTEVVVKFVTVNIVVRDVVLMIELVVDFVVVSLVSVLGQMAEVAVKLAMGIEAGDLVLMTGMVMVSA